MIGCFETIQDRSSCKPEKEIEKCAVQGRLIPIFRVTLCKSEKILSTV